MDQVPRKGVTPLAWIFWTLVQVRRSLREVDKQSRICVRSVEGWGKGVGVVVGAAVVERGEYGRSKGEVDRHVYSVYGDSSLPPAVNTSSPTNVCMYVCIYIYVCVCVCVCTHGAFLIHTRGFSEGSPFTTFKTPRVHKLFHLRFHEWHTYTLSSLSLRLHTLSQVSLIREYLRKQQAFYSLVYARDSMSSIYHEQVRSTDSGGK